MVLSCYTTLGERSSARRVIDLNARRTGATEAVIFHLNTNYAQIVIQ